MGFLYAHMSISEHICVCKRVSVCVCVSSRVCVPPDGHSKSLGGAGAGTDDLWLQALALEDVEEGVA